MAVAGQHNHSRMTHSVVMVVAWIEIPRLFSDVALLERLDMIEVCLLSGSLSEILSDHIILLIYTTAHKARRVWDWWCVVCLGSGARVAGFIGVC